MNSQLPRALSPTEALYLKLFEVVVNYTTRNPAPNGPAITAVLMQLIQSRRNVLMRSESQFKSLWLEDISLNPQLVDFFLGVGSDLKFIVEFDSVQGSRWEDIVRTLANSLIVYNDNGGDIINIEIRERLADDPGKIYSILSSNDWVVVYLLLQKLSLPKLAAHFEIWRNSTTATDQDS